MTAVVFSASLLFALASLSFFLVDEQAAMVVSACSAAFSFTAIWVSEHRGFVRTRQARRAFEPARHFSGVQVLLLFVLALAQIGLICYHLLT